MEIWRYCQMRWLRHAFGFYFIPNATILVLFCMASQIPYRNVWLHGAPFAYDALTSFTPTYTALLNSLRAHEHVFHVFNEIFPLQLQPAYLWIGNIVRQVAALFMPNTPEGHAYVQAIHSVVLVPAVALLFHSFSVPFRYGILGGAIYGLSGIHVSVSQHTGTHEALLYLVLSLFLLRIFVRNFCSFSRTLRLAVLCGSVVVLSSVIRWYHEPVLYCLPVLVWIGVHLWRYCPDSRQTQWNLAINLVILGLFVALCSLPILMTAYEMSQVNKSHIETYAETTKYFSEGILFWLALLFPNSTGATYAVGPADFSVGTDPTLGYAFAGSFTVFFATLYLLVLIRSGERRLALIILSIGAVTLGFAMGPGSPVYWILCHLLPPLWMIGHPWYGLHIFYLLSAYCVVQGMKTAIEDPDQRLLASALLISVVLIGILLYVLFPAYHYAGFSGSRQRFQQVILNDGLKASIKVAVVGLSLLLVSRGNARANRSIAVTNELGALSGQTKSFYWQFGLLILLGSIVVADLVRPTMNAHFVPTKRTLDWIRSDVGEFKPGQSIVKFLAEQRGQQPDFRALRVLSLVGWQGNALYPIGVAQLSGYDSQGNRFLEAALKLPPSAERIKWLVETYGIDFIWVARWSDSRWREVLGSTYGIEKVASDPVGGDVYAMPSNHLGPILKWDGASRATLSWFSSAGIIERNSGQFGMAWHFDLSRYLRESNTGETVVTLPMMWLSLFDARSAAGGPIDLRRNADGLIEAVLRGSTDHEFTISYPSPLFRYGIMAAAIVYWVCVAALALCTFLKFGRYGKALFGKSLLKTVTEPA